jgi:hypothetical protein
MMVAVVAIEIRVPPLVDILQWADTIFMKQFSMIRIDSVWYAPPIGRADEVIEWEGGTSWLWRGRRRRFR